MSNKLITSNSSAAPKNQLKSFQNEIESLKTSAIAWHNNEYKTSNERLYGMFADLYRIYETCTDSSNSGNTQKRKWLQGECERRKIKLNKKPTTQQLLVKYAFTVDGIDCSKRISTYARIFTIATAEQDVYADNIAEWISNNGGIEEMRQQSTKSSATKSQRVCKGFSILKDAVTITSIKTTDSSIYAAEKKDEVVLLVGVLQADGNIAVKHTIFNSESNSAIKGKTAINTALCNVYSKHNETLKKTKATQETENSEKVKNDNIDNILSNSKVVNDDMKEVA